MRAMYAVVRLNSFDVSKLTAGAGKLNEFDQTHAAQPGYLGSLVVDLQAGKRLALNLWESEEHAADAGRARTRSRAAPEPAHVQAFRTPRRRTRDLRRPQTLEEHLRPLRERLRRSSDPASRSPSGQAAAPAQATGSGARPPLPGGPSNPQNWVIGASAPCTGRRSARAQIRRSAQLSVSARRFNVTRREELALPSCVLLPRR